MRIPLLLLAAAAALDAGPAQAGPYSDDMARCLVKSTTTADKATLVRWIFSVASLHAEVRSISAMTESERAALSRDTARLFESLLTERCRTQTTEALRYEGTGTLEASFGVLGQAAMMELFSSPAVAQGLVDFSNHLDKAKLEGLLAPAPQPDPR